MVESENGMPKEVSYTLNGMPLDTNGFHVTVGTTWRAAITPRRTVTTVQGRHGSITPGRAPRFDEREITITTIAHGVESATMAERFLRLLTTPTLTLGKTEHDLTAGTSRIMSTRAELTSLTANDTERPWRPYEQYTAVLALPDVFWTETARTIELPATGGTLLAAGNADAPITDPIIRLNNPTAVTITNPASNTDITWGGSTDTSKPYLFLDPANLTAWRSNTATAWDTGTSTTPPDYTSEPLEIWPDNNGNYTIKISQNTTQKTAIHIKPAWW